MRASSLQKKILPLLRQARGKFFGLRFQIITFMAALTIALVLALGFVWLRLLERNFVRMKYAAGATIISTLQSQIQREWKDRPFQPAQRWDKQRLQSLIQTFSNNLQLKKAFLVGPDRKIIAHQRFDMVGQPYSDEDIEEAFEELELVPRYIKSGPGLGLGDEVIVSGPLFLGNRPVAVVRFGLPMEDVAAAAAGARRVLFLYMMLAGIVTALFGSLFLVRVLIRPLRELAEATERITGGDLSDWTPVGYRNEFGILAQALSRLHDSLKTQDEKVQQQKMGLQRAAERLNRMEDQVIRQDRLVTVGRVAAGVAHEIGNPLGAVYNYLGVLRGGEMGEKEKGEILEHMERELERIDRIMRELLDFSRQQPPEPVPVNIPDFVAECVSILRDQRQLDSVDTEIHKEGKIPFLQIDPAQLKQVMFNTLTNARDAMAGIGKIDIVIEAINCRETRLLESRLGEERSEEEGPPFTDLLRRGIVFSSKPAFYTGEDLVAIHIRDHGPGLSRENTQRVFEPFFTTKGAGKGTGLGLAICQRIVESFGGLLRFESRRADEFGESGSVLSIYLPTGVFIESESDDV